MIAGYYALLMRAEVEYVTAEHIGVETVIYAGNILKYFIAYQRVMEGKAGKDLAIESVKGLALSSQ